MNRTRHALTGAVALVALSAGVIACSSGDDVAETTTTTTVAPDASASSPLEGTWRTASVTPTDAEEALSRAGLSEWIEEFRARAPFEGDTVLVLEIGEEWDLYGESEDGTRSEIDFDAAYEVDGDEVVVTHSAGSNTFRWEVVDDTLTLEHVETTMPDFEGIPESVFQRAPYTAADFTRDA
jgi:hypothetical protein